MSILFRYGSLLLGEGELKITLDSGVYTVTGTVLGLTTSQNRLTLGSGEYNVTGAAIGLSADRKLSLGAGEYVLTGSDVALDLAVRIVLGSGTYTVTGSDLGFAYPYVMTLGTGSHALTGTDAALKFNRLLSLGSGAHVLTGTALGFGFTTTEQIRPGTVVYLFTLTGSADGTTDVEIPIKSLQARMRSGSPTYVQVSIPKLSEYETYITNRPNGTMEIDVAYLLDGEYTLRETIISVTLDDIRTDDGPFNKSITLTGRQQKTYSNKSITLYRPIYKNLLNGQYRYRFAEPHVYLFPGDTVTIDSDTFIANVISYYVYARTGGADTRMEIAEGSTY